MADRKLGKKRAVHNPLIPPFHKLATKRLEAVPDTSNWWAKVGEWTMALNDTLSCCVQASETHQITQRECYANRNDVFSDASVEQLYRRQAGYDGTPATDGGTIMSDAMADWVKNGIFRPDGGLDKPDAIASVHLTSLWLRRAIWHSGGILIGVNFPTRWLDVDYLWDLQPGDLQDIAGGHCLFIAGYEKVGVDANGEAEFEADAISWGKRYRMALPAMEAVIDEAYAILDADWLDDHGQDPAGFDWAQATAAMKELTGAA